MDEHRAQRYVADQADDTSPLVLDITTNPCTIVCGCRTWERAEEIASLLNDNEGAVELIRELADPDPCHYDHHGYCQAHSGHERPCPHERARDLLGWR